jgi:hypothetical protein
LKLARIIVDCETKRWRYKIDSAQVQMETPEQFTDSLGDEPMVYAVLVGAEKAKDDS